MTGSTVDSNLASTPRWFLSLTGTFLATLIVMGIVISAASVFALLLGLQFYPDWIGIHWLAVFGLIIAFAGPNLTEDEEKAFTEFAEGVLALDGMRRLIYGMTFFTLLVGMVSFEIGAITIVVGIVTENTSFDAAALAAAVVYPMVDVWLGRHVGGNVATIGGLIAVVVMILVALALQVSTEIPRKAASDFQRSFS